MASGLFGRTMNLNLFSKLCGFAATPQIHWCVNSLSIERRREAWGYFLMKHLCFSFRRPHFFFFSILRNFYIWKFGSVVCLYCSISFLEVLFFPSITDTQRTLVFGAVGSGDEEAQCGSCHTLWYCQGTDWFSCWHQEGDTYHCVKISSSSWKNSFGQIERDNFCS